MSVFFINLKLYRKITWIAGVKLTRQSTVDDSKQLGYSDDEDYYYPSDDDCVNLTPSDYNYCYNY